MGVSMTSEDASEPTLREVVVLLEAQEKSLSIVAGGVVDLQGRFGRLEKTVDGLVEDMVVVKAVLQTNTRDIAVLKTDVSELKTDVAVLKTDVAILKTDVHEIKVDLRSMDRRVTAVESTPRS